MVRDMPYTNKVEREFMVGAAVVNGQPCRVVDQLIKVKSPSGKVTWAVTRLAVVNNHADPSVRVYRRKTDALQDILESRGIE